MLKLIHAEKAPPAIGPYSQGVIAEGKLIFTAGQIPLDPKSGDIVVGGIVEQTHRVLQNLSAVLEAGGASLKRVVKTTVFLQNLDDFAAMNAVYGEYFQETPPARSTMQVAKLPRGALVEIEAIAQIEP
jgi:2-iminobutanoate/2-iminopropanoate deaminase